MDCAQSPLRKELNRSRHVETEESLTESAGKAFESSLFCLKSTRNPSQH